MRWREGKESNEKESLRKSGAAYNYKFVAKYYDDGDEINKKNSHRFHNYNRKCKERTKCCHICQSTPTPATADNNKSKKHDLIFYKITSKPTQSVRKTSKKTFSFCHFDFFSFWCVLLFYHCSSGIVSAITSHKEIKKNTRERRGKETKKRSRTQVPDPKM